MARRLAGEGFPLVVSNRTAQVATDLADEIGATAVPTPAEAAAGADAVITSLADDAAALLLEPLEHEPREIPG